MKRVLFVLLVITALSISNRAQTAVTVFEGARVIAGDGQAPIENAAIVVDGARITQVGRAGGRESPGRGHPREPAGKTVMPTIVDTHTHLARSARRSRRISAGAPTTA